MTFVVDSDWVADWLKGRPAAVALLIATTALVHGLTLVTRNRRHFERIPGLPLYP